MLTKPTVKIPLGTVIIFIYESCVFFFLVPTQNELHGNCVSSLLCADVYGNLIVNGEWCAGGVFGTLQKGYSIFIDGYQTSTK